MARLVLQTAEGQQIVELRQTNSLGRHPSNTIQLLDKIVSKEHCIIEKRGSQFHLRDLGSLNGTYVNRDRVQGESELRNGDEISLGQTKARFEEMPVSNYPPPPSTTAAAPQWQQQGWPPQSVAVPSHQQYQALPQQQPGYARQQPPSSLPQQQGYPPHGYPQQPPPVGSGAAPQQQPPPIPHRRPPPPRTPSRGFNTAYLPAVPTSTQVDTHDEARQIGAELPAIERDFHAFDEIANNRNQLRLDYERLRLIYTLTRDVSKEWTTGGDFKSLLDSILKNIFRVVPAHRGVIFLLPDGGDQPVPFANHRTDGTNTPISVSTTIINKVVEDRKAVLTHDAAMDFAASKGKSMILNQIQSAIVVPMIHADHLLGVLWLDSKSLAQFQPKDLDLVSSVANQAAMFIEAKYNSDKALAERTKQEVLGRFLSPNIKKRVLEQDLEVAPGGSRMECTVFNSDIRGFTRMSEHTSPEELVEMLNAYFEKMVQEIFDLEGTLDKFMGDGIMALWGAPVAHDDDPERAVECALRQVEVLGTFNRERMKKDRPPLGVGFGIHSGGVVAGFMGVENTLNYTVIGDVANVSARLCAKARAGQIIVSDETRSLLGPRFEVEELPPAHVRGRDKPLRVFNVVRSTPISQVPSTSKAGAEKAGGVSSRDQPTASQDAE